MTQGYIAEQDYPLDALTLGETGTSSVKFTVLTNGRVTDCTIVFSAGSALDEQACKLITERFRYSPALDLKGKPTSEVRNQAVRWVLPPIERRNSNPAVQRDIFTISNKGLVARCVVEPKDSPVADSCDLYKGQAVSYGKNVRVDQLLIDSRVVTSKNEYEFPPLPPGKWTSYLVTSYLTINNDGSVAKCSLRYSFPDGKTWSGECPRSMMEDHYFRLSASEATRDITYELRISMIGVGLENRLQKLTEPKYLATNSHQISGSIETYDYPQESLAKREEGIVQITYIVGTDGRISNCDISRSSGYPALDKRSCELMVERYVYEPATDASGQKIPTQSVTYISWKLPEIKIESSAPFTVKMRLPIGADGKLGQCTAEKSGAYPEDDFCKSLLQYGNPPEEFMRRYPGGGTLFGTIRQLPITDFDALQTFASAPLLMDSLRYIVVIAPDGTVTDCEVRSNDSDDMKAKLIGNCKLRRFDPVPAKQGIRTIVNDMRVTYDPNIF